MKLMAGTHSITAEYSGDVNYFKVIAGVLILIGTILLLVGKHIGFPK